MGFLLGVLALAGWQAATGGAYEYRVVLASEGSYYVNQQGWEPVREETRNGVVVARYLRRPRIRLGGPEDATPAPPPTPLPTAAPKPAVPVPPAATRAPVLQTPALPGCSTYFKYDPSGVPVCVQ